MEMKGALSPLEWQILTMSRSRMVGELTLASFGFLQSGSGSYGTAYVREDTCVKVSGSDGARDGWADYAEWIFRTGRTLACADHFPKIVSFHRVRDFAFAEMEKLHSNYYSDAYNLHGPMALYFTRGLFGREADYTPEELPQTLRDALDAIREAAPHHSTVPDTVRAYGYDLHEGNWMIRAGDIPVITDPVSGLYNV